MKKIGSYFISAGEYSGDLIATELIHQIAGLYPRVKAFGVCGPSMRSARARSVIDMEQFEVLGFAEVLNKLPEIAQYEMAILEEIDRVQPDIAILVDYPGFHIHVAEKLKERGIPVIQYVAPKVWAWGQGRVKKIKEYFDLVLGILPFEEKFYLNHGVNFKFVGSPHKDRIEKVVVEKADLGFSQDRKIVACLPGSRSGEISRILPTLAETASVLSSKHQKIDFVVPLAPNFDFAWFEEHAPERKKFQPQRFSKTNEFPFDGIQYGPLKIIAGMSLELMKVADAAIVASGTATLECFLLGCPLVVVYKVSKATYEIGKKISHVDYVSLVNLFDNSEVVKEFLQVFEVSDVVDETEKILFDDDYRGKMIGKFQKMSEGLKGDAPFFAALEIKKYIESLDLKPKSEA